MSYQTNETWRLQRADRINRENRLDRICAYLTEIETEGTRLNQLFTNYPNDPVLKFDYQQILHALEHLRDLCASGQLNQKPPIIRALMAEYLMENT